MLKVLIVEDDLNDREIIRDLLRDVGREMELPVFVEYAVSAKAAGDLAGIEQYDLFVVDYYLAGSTGLEFIRRLRRSGKLPPVVMISGRDNIEMPVEIMEWMARGEFTFLPKTDLDRGSFLQVFQDIMGPEVNVLLIDDDEEEFLLTNSYLCLSPSHRFRVHWASCLDDAREQLRERAFDAILIDYQLGEETGTDFVLELIATQVRVPLVLFTGQDSLQANEDIVRMISRRKLGFLAKKKMSTETLTQALVHTLN